MGRPGRVRTLLLPPGTGRDRQQRQQPAETTALSSLSQSLGYLAAALGPFAVGLLRSASGGWTLPMAALLVTAAAQLAVGMALSAQRR